MHESRSSKRFCTISQSLKCSKGKKGSYCMLRTASSQEAGNMCPPTTEWSAKTAADVDILFNDICSLEFHKDHMHGENVTPAAPVVTGLAMVLQIQLHRQQQMQRLTGASLTTYQQASQRSSCWMLSAPHHHHPLPHPLQPSLSATPMRPMDASTLVRAIQAAEMLVRSLILSKHYWTGLVHCKQPVVKAGLVLTQQNAGSS